MNRLDHDEVRLRIQAPPGLLYDLVSDVPRTPEWSPEVISCRWLDGAAGAVPGARFSARNKRRWAAWSNKPVVETAERGQEAPPPSLATRCSSRSRFSCTSACAHCSGYATCALTCTRT